MQAPPLRVRLAPTFEWVVAAAFLAATLAVALLLLQEMRGASPATPVTVPAEPRAATPGAIPERAVAVSTLMLMDGTQVKIGDSAEQVSKLLGVRAEVGQAATEPGPLGPRTTRSYDRQGTRFLLVFEPFERNGAPRVAGIYLQ